MKKLINKILAPVKGLSSKVKREEGFTLAEIMVTAGIVAVLAVAIMRMNSMAQKTAKTTAQNLESTQLFARAQQILSDPVSCKETFKTKVPTAGGIPITKIVRGVYNATTHTTSTDDVMGAGNTCVTNTTKPGGSSPCISAAGTSGKIGIHTMTFKLISGGPNGAATGSLDIHFVKGAGANSSWDYNSTTKEKTHSLAAYGANDIVKKIPVNLVLTSGAVTACYTTEDNILEQACTNAGGTYNAAVTPACALPNPDPQVSSCRTVAMTAVGTVTYGSVTVGSSGMGACNANEVMAGIQIDTASTAYENAIVDSSTVRFPKVQLTLKCCVYKKP